MRTLHRKFLIIAALALLLLVGCAPQTTGLPIEALQATAEEIVRQTESVLPTVAPIPTLTPYTITPRVTTTDTPTLTTTSTPTSTFTFTPAAQVFMTGDTNCREGPSTHYGFVTLIQAGQTAEIVGKDRDGNYWKVNNPNGAGTCWIWNAFATPSGPLNRIAALNAPPTRTPTFTATSTPRLLASIRYYRLTTCDGLDAIIVRIYNYSRRELDGWRAQIWTTPDRTFQAEVESDQFAHADSTCAETLSRIKYRNVGYAVIPFDASTTSRYLVEFDVCTMEGTQRDCISYLFYVNSPYYVHTATPTNTSTLTPTPITPTP